MASWSPQERDAVLYSGSALFAIVTAQTASIALYQQWGRLAVGPYAVGAVASAWAARRARRRKERAVAAAGAGAASPTPASAGADGGRGPGWHWTGPRAVIFLVVLLGATLVPLALEVMWRTDTGGTAHVQPEVPVIEQAGQAYVHGHDPYREINPKSPPPVPAGQPAYDAYDPYLPLMSWFGGPRSTHAPPRLTDARVAFSVFTILIVVVAMALCRGPTGPRVLALQSMTVLPTAALPLATGGDDVPVAALLLLGLVLLQRRRPLWAGAVLGVAASMKITAWPLALLAFVVARDRDGRRGRRPSLLVLAGLFGVMIPAILPTALENLPAFIDNVVRFPLGLAGVRSPAGSPLLGHFVVSLFPGFHRAFTVLVAGTGIVVLAYVLARRRPTTPAGLSSLVGWVMTVAIFLAPATRVGYFLYPIDFFVWAWLLRGEDSVDDPLHGFDDIARRAASEHAEYAPVPHDRSADSHGADGHGADSYDADGDDPDRSGAGRRGERRRSSEVLTASGVSRRLARRQSQS